MENENKVAIVGSGLVGCSWAMIFAASGYKVAMYDIGEDQLKGAKERLLQELHKLKETGFLRGNLSVEEQLSLISFSTSLADCIKDAFYIQECVWEDESLKRDTFSKIDVLTVPGQIMASSASVLTPSSFTSHVSKKEFCVVAHPINPPFFCPVVEVCPNSWTKPEVVDRTCKLLKEVGQDPVRLKKEVLGSLVNRLQYALLAEAWRLVQDDVASIEDVDKVFTEGLGMRYAFIGPFEVCNLNAKGIEEYCQKYNGIYKAVTDSFGPAPDWSGTLLDNVKSQMEEKVPLDKVPEKCLWRNECLMKLAKLKSEMKRAE